MVRLWGYFGGESKQNLLTDSTCAIQENEGDDGVVFTRTAEKIELPYMEMGGTRWGTSVPLGCVDLRHLLDICMELFGRLSAICGRIRGRDPNRGVIPEPSHRDGG